MAVVAKVFKGFGRHVERDRRKLYSLHVSHSAQGEVSIKFSVLKDGTWERAHGKAIAIAKLITEFLTTPDNDRFAYLHDVLGAECAEQLIGLVEGGADWCDFVAVLAFPTGSPPFWDGDRYMDSLFLTTDPSAMRENVLKNGGGRISAVDVDKEYLRAIAL